MTSPKRTALRFAWIALLVSVGCRSDKAVLAPVPPCPCGIHSVIVLPPVVTMRVGDTLTLHAEDSQDSTIRQLTWGSADSIRVKVDAQGRLQALAATPGTGVCASTFAFAVGCATVAVTP
jgi:hypothetical protein